MSENYFDIPFEITNPLEKKIAEVFLVYDHNAVNMIDKFDVGAVLRSLGCVPTEQDIADIVAKTEFPSHPGNIHITKFIPYLKGLLLNRRMKPSPPEEILEAFKVLDPQNKRFIEKETFHKMMTEYGDAMTDDELITLMKSAVNPSDNRVYYENYIYQLIHEPEDSIYSVAEKLAASETRASQKRFNMFGKKP